jgi:predicted kinase
MTSARVPDVELRTLAASLAAGRATEADLMAVGAALAHLHAGLEPAPAGDATDRLAAAVEQTLAGLSAAGAGLFAPAQLAALTRFVRSALAGFGPQLREREAAGLVRTGHGDLRAEHVVLGETIELVAAGSDEALRVADVACDLAFLVMDVARRDERLARALVRGYAAAGGARVDDRVLAFFVALRALGQTAGLAGDGQSERASEALALAERFAWRTRLPRVVCVAGLTASGKSTLAAALGSVAALPVLSSDLIRRVRAATDAREDGREVYDRLGRDAGAAARDEGGAIVDATFRHPGDVAAFEAASGAAARAGWIVCHAPPEVLLERARWSAMSDADPAVVATEIARSGGQLSLPRTPLAQLETVRAVPRLLDELAAVLDARLALG